MALAVWLASALLLPLWIRHSLGVMARDLAGARELRCGQIRIGVFSADVYDISVGQGSLPPLRFESCHASYSPLSLLRWRLDKVSLSGLNVALESKGEKLFLNGSALPVAFDGGTPGVDVDSSLSALARMPFSIGCVELKSSELDFHGSSTSIAIPFKLALTPSDSQWSKAAIALDAYPNGQAFKALLNVDKASSRVEARIWTPRKALLEATPFARNMVPAANVSGDLALEATASFSGKRARLDALDVAATVEQFNFRAGALQLSGANGAPVRFVLNCKDGKGSFSLSGLRQNGVFPTDLKSFSSAWTFENGELSASSEIELSGAGKGAPFKTPAKFALESKGVFKGIALRELSGSLRLAGESKSVLLSLPFASLRADEPQLAFSLVPDGSDAKLDAFLGASSLCVSAAEASLETKALALSAKGSFSRKIHVEASVSDVCVEGGSVAANAPKIVFSAEREKGRVSGLVSFNDASLSDACRGLEASGAALKLPFQIPLSAKARTGELSVKSVALRGRNAGALSSKLLFNGSGLDFSGRFASADFKGLTIDFDGASHFEDGAFDAKAKFFMPPFKFAEPVDLGLFRPEEAGILAGGELSFDGLLSIEGKAKHGSMTIRLKDAFAKDAGGLFSVEGVYASMKFSKLPELRSDPSQAISFAKASFGKLALRDGKILARLDAADSIFVEDFKASFCGGTVRTQAFELAPGSGAYDLVLHCDRVSLASFLSQAGFGQVEGEGSLNGSVPLSVRDGSLSFKDAFLYSTPGVPGVLRVENRLLLAAGFPESSEGQPVYVDIARESLKGYSFAWAKIDLDSDGDDLLLKLHLSGKPEKPLPFRVEDGSYVYDGEGRLAFQSVLMDLNFRLSMSQVIGVGGGLKKIFKGESGK